MSSDRVVWIIGAGFSRPLGGPLLTDLFSWKSERDLEARYPKDRFPRLHGHVPQTARWLFHYGTRFDQGKPRYYIADGEALWQDAEGFLDYLDVAAV